MLNVFRMPISSCPLYCPTILCKVLTVGETTRALDRGTSTHNVKTRPCELASSLIYGYRWTFYCLQSIYEREKKQNKPIRSKITNATWETDQSNLVTILISIYSSERTLASSVKQKFIRENKNCKSCKRVLSQNQACLIYKTSLKL